MSPNRLLTAAAALAVAAIPMTAAAQVASQPTTEAAARAATGKASTDAPAASQVHGTAKAVKEAAPAAASAAAPAAAQAPAEGAAAPAAPAAMAKPVVMNGDLVDTLKLNGQFTQFVAGIDSTNLAGLLKTNKNLTVFAPTDAAFAAMPAAELQTLKTDKAAMQKFVLRHVINAPVDTTKIKGAKGPVPSGSQEQILLDGSDEAKLVVGGATILQADVKTGSGLLHVVDKVLTPGVGDWTPAAAEAPSAAAAGSSSAATTSAPASGTNTAPKP